jgi:hypothetical protein
VSVMKIHETLTLIHDYQKHHRLREARGRDTAEYLNERVQYWSLGEALLLVVVGLFQVLTPSDGFSQTNENRYSVIFSFVGSIITTMLCLQLCIHVYILCVSTSYNFSVRSKQFTNSNSY